MPLRAMPLVALTFTLLACATACGGGGGEEADARTGNTGACPSPPVPVVVTVDQWGDIVEQLAGECADVTTIISGTTGDPHDYEPTPADLAVFAEAQLVVQNGLDYDSWADRAIEALSRRPAVVDAGDVAGEKEGDNPHLWYGPDYVFAVADAVSTELERLVPEAGAYLDRRRAAWLESMKPYTDEIEAIKAADGGATYGATESVFDYMAEAVGLEDVTPEGYRNAAANESDPGPGDLGAFDQELSGGGVDVLVYNVQTEGSIPEQVRGTAEQAGVPVVEVTETVPEDAASFSGWQIDQLRSLSAALDNR